MMRKTEMIFRRPIWRANGQRALLAGIRAPILTAMLAVMLTVAVTVTGTGAALAAALQTEAREALLIDFDTGAVLYEKNADASMPPASMSKIMTAYLTFEAIEEGRLALDDEILISENASKKGGSRMFLESGSQVKLQDVLRGIIVQSGNDASIALAEAVAGSEQAFARRMTEKARELGMTGSRFRNATGWPDPDHRMTARDLATLARATIVDFPQFYPLYSETEFTYNKIKQGNRNPLLYEGGGADGLKTGHTEEAGYGLTASVKRGGRRLLMVLNGLSSKRARADESKRVMAWGFAEYDNYLLLEADAEVAMAGVWLGEAPTVPLVLAEDLLVTMRVAAREQVKVTVVHTDPLPAPIAKGDAVAIVRITAPDMEAIERPLIAGAAVNRQGPLGRLVSAVGHLLWGE